MDILKISIAVSIIGIVSLFFLTRIFEEEITDITDLKIGQIEKISGMVTSVYVSRDSHVFIKVADRTGEITVVAFKNSNIDKAYDLEVGEEISVLGRVDEYEGDIEIIASEIETL
ncbi:MAG: OB-fold nucleic acid binding domain-containing protein [Candidatus Aenigmarchaeota archaeon]|nr:OB-fold nucleic acid binding domain-containing protein [Candidatus Aenigmarchaeota archaeon]